MTYYRRGRAVRDYDIRISASLHLILLLVQQSQTGCYVTWNQICVLQHDREDLTVGFASVEIIFDAAYFNVKYIIFFQPVFCFVSKISYREEAAEELRDAGKRCPGALVLRQAAA